jgi:Ni/Co efflux regulator RcnB
MKRIIFGVLILGSLFTAQIASAQTRTPVINERQEHQQHRIKQGVRSGELTRHETRNLERREAKIQRDKRIAKSNGRVSPAERRHLRREENRTSHAIYRDKHNAVVR